MSDPVATPPCGTYACECVPGCRDCRDDATARPFRAVGAHVDAVAPGAHAARALAGERGTDADALELEVADGVGDLVGDRLVFLDDRLVGDRVADRVAGRAADDHVLQLDLDRLALIDGRLGDAVEGVAVDLVDDDVLRHVRQLAGEVTGVGGLEGRVGQPLAGAVGGGEVFQHVQAFAEVGPDRRLDDLARRLGHQAAHAAELADLVDVTAGAGDRHHGDRVEVAEGARVVRRHRLALGVAVVLGEAGHQVLGDLLAGVAPDVDELGVPLLLGDGAHAVVLLDLVGLLLAFLENRQLAIRAADVGDAKGEPGKRRSLEAERLHVVQQLDRRRPP